MRLFGPVEWTKERWSEREGRYVRVDNPLKDPWGSERVKKDRSTSMARKYYLKGSPKKKATPSRKNRLTGFMIAGLGIGGYLLYSMLKNPARAAIPAGSTPNGSLNVLGDNPYTAAALDQSVPGVSFAPSSLQSGILTSTLTAVPAVTAPQVAAARSFWSTLTPVSPPASGYITFPSGTQVAAALMSGGNTAQDGNGNLYVQWAGQAYQLGQQDSAGNYPALSISSGTAAAGPTTSFLPGVSTYASPTLDAGSLFSLSGFGAAPDMRRFNRQRWG